MYRILTERKNVEQVKQTLGMLGLDYTLYYGDGSWHGHAESSMAIELADVSIDCARQAATSIKFINEQEAILLQQIEADSELL
jgi:hypothetical protein